MSESKEETDGTRPRKEWLWGLGLMGLGAVLGPAMLLGSVGSFSYVGGLLNMAPMFAALLAVATWGSLLVYALLRLVTALRSTKQVESPVALWVAVIVAVLLSCFLQFTEATPNPMKLFARGFERRLEVLTDIEAIQAWVVALDPNDYAGQPRDYFRERLEKQDQPPVVACLNADARIELDDMGRPKLRLRWDAGRAGFWGLVVGHKEMETPPSDWSMYGERTHELRKGVYFWSEEG